MKAHSRQMFALPVAMAALLLGLAASVTWAEEIPLAETEIFFELNDTDGDLGIHALIDGDAWKRLQIMDINERRLLNIRVIGRLQRQGLTEIFFESAEPTFDELDPADFFRRFPAGEYEVEALGLEGEELEGETELTHLIPAGPEPTVNDEPKAEVCDDEDPDYDATEVTAPVTIAWPEVERSHATLGSPTNSTDIEVLYYTLVVEAETEDGLEVVMSIELPPGVTSMEIPAEFIELGEEFKYEILVREESYNQSATESCFIVVDE